MERETTLTTTALQDMDELVIDLNVRIGLDRRIVKSINGGTVLSRE